MPLYDECFLIWQLNLKPFRVHAVLKGGPKKQTGMYFLGLRTGRFLSKRALLETKEQIAR